MPQVSREHLSEDATEHIARLVATSEADSLDSVAYLSPLLAFNLGFQQHLEAFLKSAEQNGNASANSIAFSQEEAQSKQQDAIKEDGREISIHKVHISRLEVPPDRTGFAAVLQSG